MKISMTFLLLSLLLIHSVLECNTTEDMEVVELLSDEDDDITDILSFLSDDPEGTTTDSTSDDPSNNNNASDTDSKKSSDTNSDAKNTVTYTEDTGSYLNPERGTVLFAATKDVDSKGKYKLYARRDIVEYRKLHTLVNRVIYLRSYIEQEVIPDDEINHIKLDLDSWRKGDFKVILRLAYTDSERTKVQSPYIESHLSQLKPIFKEYEDIIFALQLGFIGAYGEYTNNSNLSIEQITTLRTKVIKAVMDATPSSYQVLARRGKYKFDAYSDHYLSEINADGIDIIPSKRDDGSDFSRIGFHNDCWLATVNDMGTYEKVSLEKKDLEADIKGGGLIWGGETCAVDGAHSGCSSALQEAKRFRMSYLNQYWNNAVLQGQWGKPTDYPGQKLANIIEDGNCWSTFQRILGYRFILQSVTMPQTVAAGGSLQYSFTINNTGASPIIYRRPIYLVFEDSNNNVVKQAIDYDIRSIQENPDNDSNRVTVISGALNLPSSLASGTYKLYLELPDRSGTLGPNFSVRFMNQNTWDGKRGFNDLQISVTITANTLLL